MTRNILAWLLILFSSLFLLLSAAGTAARGTLAGDHVDTIEHRGWAGDEGTEYWDLVSRNDQEIVSGLYIYRIETETEFVIGKFAVIK